MGSRGNSRRAQRTYSTHIKQKHLATILNDNNTFGEIDLPPSLYETSNNVENNQHAGIREIPRKVVQTIRTSRGLNGRIRCSDLLARNAMKHFRPITYTELQNVIRDANRKKLRARITLSDGKLLLRAHPREPCDRSETLIDHIEHDTQDTGTRSSTTSSHVAHEDTEQRILTIQETLMRHCSKHGIGRPQGKHEKE